MTQVRWAGSNQKSRLVQKIVRWLQRGVKSCAYFGPGGGGEGGAPRSDSETKRTEKSGYDGRDRMESFCWHARCLSPPGGTLSKKGQRHCQGRGAEGALSDNRAVLLYLKFPFHEEIRVSRQTDRQTDRKYLFLDDKTACSALLWAAQLLRLLRHAIMYFYSESRRNTFHVLTGILRKYN